MLIVILRKIMFKQTIVISWRCFATWVRTGGSFDWSCRNKQMMLSQRPSWFLIPDPIIAQWAPPDDWGVESQHPQSVATMNGQSWSAEALHLTEYISYLPCLMTWPLMLSLFIPTATARAREVGYYVLLLLVIVKLEDIIINWKTALKMVIVKTQ